MTTAISRTSSTIHRRKRPSGAQIIVHLVLIVAVVVALYPVLLVLMDSFKSKAAIYSSPFAVPTAGTFSLDGYISVFTEGDFGRYYLNSIIVTVVSVVLVVVLSSLAAFGLSEYRVRLNPVTMAIFVVGIMLPIRLGTVALLKMMSAWGLVNTLTSLIIIYVASSLPLAVVLMSTYMRTVPDELKEAARIDGANEWRVFTLIAPLTRPGMAAVASVTMLPIWNDLWFPLILAPGESTQTVTLGVQQFVGQFSSDWSALLAALTMGAIPLIALFAIFSRQFIAGLSQGIGK